MMDLDLRFYKRYDVDLIALHAAGLPIGEYIKQALIAYVSGKPYHIYVPFVMDHDFSDRQLLHTQVKIEDTNSEILLAQIKRGYRNTFCKLLLRNALVYQNLGIFHSDSGYRRIERERIAAFDPEETPGTLVAMRATALPSNKQDKILKRAVRQTAQVTPPSKRVERTAHTPAVKQTENRPSPKSEQTREEKTHTDQNDQQALLSIFQDMVANQ